MLAARAWLPADATEDLDVVRDESPLCAIASTQDRERTGVESETTHVGDVSTVGRPDRTEGVPSMSEAHGTICTPGASRCDENVAPLRVYRIVGRVVFPPLEHDAVGRWRPIGQRVARAASYQVQVFPARGDSRDVSRESALPHTHCQPPRHAPSRVSDLVKAREAQLALARSRRKARDVGCEWTVTESQASRRWGQPRGRVLVIEGGVDRKAATPTAVRTDDVNPVAGARIAVIAMRIDDQSTVRRERRICVRPAEIDARATPRWTGELPDMRGPRISEPNSGLDVRPDTAVRQQPVSAGERRLGSRDGEHRADHRRDRQPCTQPGTHLLKFTTADANT